MISNNNSHKNLSVWQKAIELVTQVYAVTKVFPKDELYGLASQMRRSAVSIPSNISEGAARKSTKEYVQFLHIALGSASELDVQLIISRNLAYIDEPKFTKLSEEREEISMMLSGLIRKLKSS